MGALAGVAVTAVEQVPVKASPLGVNLGAEYSVKWLEPPKFQVFKQIE